MLVNSGTAPTPSKHGLLSTALYRFGKDAPTTYALEGAVASVLASRRQALLRPQLLARDALVTSRSPHAHPMLIP